MTTAPAIDATTDGRPGYDPDAGATARRVIPLLARERVLWLSTVGTSGAPHLVPTWFWWDGEAMVFWSKPDAVKVRNIRANPRLMVAVGDPVSDFSVGLIEAAAEPVDAPVPDAFFAKYRAELGEGRLDPATFRAVYTQAVRVVPSRFLAWHGRGARHDVPASPRTPIDAPHPATTPRAGIRTPERGAHAGLAAPVVRWLADRLDEAAQRLRAATPGPVRATTV